MTPPSSDISRKFRALFPDIDSDNLRYDGFKMPLLRDLLACLHPSNIPKNPFDQSTVSVVAEGFDALHIYARLCADVDRLPSPAMHKALFEPFWGVWQWMHFMNPHLGNFADDEVGLGARSHSACFLQSDGRLSLASTIRVHLASTFICGVMRTPRGMQALAACPGLVDDVLSMITMLSPSHPKPDLAASQHLLAQFFVLLLSQKDPSIRNPFHAGLLAFDKENPGKLLDCIINHLVWLIDPSCGRDGAEDDYVDAYSNLLNRVLLKNPQFVENLKTQGDSPVRYLVCRIEDIAAPRLHRAPAYKHHALALLVDILSHILIPEERNPRVSHLDLIEALDFRLLLTIRWLLIEGKLIRQSASSGYKYADVLARETRRLITHAVMPSLVWPDLRRAVQESMLRDGVLLDDAPADEAMLVSEWAHLERCYQFFLGVRLTYQKWLASARQACANADCSSDVEAAELMMCSCGSTFYCSVDCQRRHWHWSHRQSCTRNNNAPAKRYLGAGPVEDARSYIKHSERAYLRMCAREGLSRYGNAASVRMHHVSTVLVDFGSTEHRHPIVHYGVLEKRPWFDLPLDPRLVRIWVQAMKGGRTYVLEVDTLPREDAAHLAGSGA
ncbi:hypothetical protein BD626DRAFT_514130 [Schizophyllum amplum]|uniref:MYND-type domain-containing protein n=1 Tax=Schizophyllum amplum TaxID=97359 RepID=A0A550BYW2_9AGAR|nr:hypothetical protein BD626DRAFT_514130 [Auriculariopsis ampla]